MTPARTRTIVRLAHLVLGSGVAALVYVPLAWLEPVRPFVGAVVVPAVVLTGLFMWQQGRIHRMIAGGRSRPTAGAGDP